jgi:hypothetical protein
VEHALHEARRAWGAHHHVRQPRRMRSERGPFVDQPERVRLERSPPAFEVVREKLRAMGRKSSSLEIFQK